LINERFLAFLWSKAVVFGPIPTLASNMFPTKYFELHSPLSGQESFLFHDLENVSLRVKNTDAALPNSAWNLPICSGFAEGRSFTEAIRDPILTFADRGSCVGCEPTLALCI